MRYRREPGPRLDQSVFVRLDRLYKATRIKASDFDSRVYELMHALAPPSAIRAIDRFQAKLSDDTRNVSALMTSVLRQVRAAGATITWTGLGFPCAYSFFMMSILLMTSLLGHRRRANLAHDSMRILFL